MIYTQDHIPAHVHVWRAGGEIVINIATLEITKAEGMSRRDSARAVEIVEILMIDLWHGCFKDKWRRGDLAEEVAFSA